MDYYAVLEVERSASQEDIKRSYRNLARQYHPDSNSEDPDSAQKFKDVAVAYEVLSDPERRAHYDRFGVDPESSGGGGAGASVNFNFGDLGDLLGSMFGSSDLFGGNRGPAEPPRGENHEVFVTLSFEESVFGVEKAINVQTMAACDVCDAVGAAAGTSPVVCRTCSGTGQVRSVRQSVMGQMVTMSPCMECGGSGEVIEEPCVTCQGNGRVRFSASYPVRIPPGIDAGQILRLPGRGAAGVRGGAPGDLLIHVQVTPHPTLVRQGFDLVDELEIPVTWAALGTEVRYDTLDGEETFKIEAGTQHGDVVRLRNKGVPHRRGRGNLLIHLNVRVPENLSEEQKQLFRQLAESQGDPVKEVEKSFFQRVRNRS